MLGSQAFLNWIKELIKQPKYGDEIPLARRLASVPIDDVQEFIAAYYGVDPASFAKPSKEARPRCGAWLARRVTTATLREPAAPFGVGHPDSVRNLIRRASDTMDNSPKFPQEFNAILRSLRQKDENLV